MTADTLAALSRSPLAWVVAVVALLLLWEAAKKWVPAGAEWLAKRLGDALAGTRLMRRRALRAYRDEVAARYALLPVPFRPGKGLDVSTVYVPLQATDEAGGQRHDAYDRIQATDHVVVLGRPGAGKSMLLRHSILTWAKEPRRRGGRIPVLLELRRCNGNANPLEQLIVEQFDRNHFPKADRFVHRSLREGKLSLLFDGLDEVGAVERGRVAQMLRDFAARHPKCQLVVTCRTAIYNRNLAPEITAIFHVAEFGERHIRRFLKKWPDIGGDVEVERLLTALRDTPRLMQLAGNPLLLTMIAYLYGGKTYQDRVLPHSRTEFYRDATEELLDRLKNENNRFPGQVKRAVLKQLALNAQDTPASTADRRALRYETVLDTISGMRERVNVAAADIDDLLGEIVDRSGLLLKIDGGDRYQFAHLTLQEYLAAAALEDDPEGLLDRYRQAPADWREVVKLWCGSVDRDCAPLIEKVYAIDPVLAFECLAEAQVVDETVARRIMDYFQSRLSTPGSSEPQSVVTAFGMVAADPRPRGRRLYEFLVRRATDEQSRTPQALSALAASKLPEAASVLSELAESDIVARESLITMGDLAVPALIAAVRNERFDAIEMLGRIGTPAAAVALASLLWGIESADYDVGNAFATRAAWHLATLISDLDVEVALDEIRPQDSWSVNSLSWIWEPFRVDSSSVLPIVAGRVAYLLDHTPDVEVPETASRVDPRIAIPLCCLGVDTRLQSLQQSAPEEMKDVLVNFARDRRDISIRHLFGVDGPKNSKVLTDHVRRDVGITSQDDMKTPVLMITDWLIGMGLPKCYAMLLRSLDIRVLLVLLVRLWGVVDDPEKWGNNVVWVRRQDWIEVRSDEASYTFARSVAHYFVLTVTAMFLLSLTVGGFRLSMQGWPVGPSWIGWICASISVLFGVIVMWALYEEMASIVLVHQVFLVDVVAFWRRRDSVVPEDFGDAVLVATFFLIILMSDFLALVVGVCYFNPWGLLGAAALIVAAMLVARHGTRRERAARNPLRGLLELDELAARGRTSVIAG